MAPYLAALVLLHLPASSERTSIQFRLIFAIGAVPALVVLYGTFVEMRRQRAAGGGRGGTGASSGRPKSHSSLLRALLDRKYGRLLVGTAGTWFIYDVAWYGIIIFTPHVLKDIFGEDNSLLATSWQSLVVSSLGLPGVIGSIVLLKRKGARWLNIYGFALIGVGFLALALVYHASPGGLKTLKFILFCFLVFTLNAGPNVATFVLPTICYPAPVRTTFHGISAAAAKLGAVFGAYLFPPLSRHVSVVVIFWIQTVIAFVGVLLSVRFIDASPADREPDHEFVAVDDAVPLSPIGVLLSDDQGEDQEREDDDDDDGNVTAAAAALPAAANNEHEEEEEVLLLPDDASEA